MAITYYEIKVFNHHAMLSCTRWNKSNWQPKTKIGAIIKVATIDKFYLLSRRYHRKKYRKIAQNYWESSWHQSIIEMARLGSPIDSYPPHYGDPRFADWDESDAADDYTLISDQSGCVIKYSTSYCAWKIFELTGKWPQKKARARLNAKNWQYFLEQAGYPNVVEDFYATFAPKHHYVGINPSDGEWGITVWFEKLNEHGEVEISTYRNKKYSYEYIPRDNIDKYTWVEIN